MTKKNITPEMINAASDAMLETYGEIAQMLKLPTWAGPAPFNTPVRFNCDEVSIRHEVRLCFGLSVNLVIEHGSRRYGGQDGPRVEVTWASGGGTVSEALAQATLQLEYTGKVAQAEMILGHAWRAVKRDGMEDAVCAELERRKNVAWEVARAEKAAQEAAVKAAKES